MIHLATDTGSKVKVDRKTGIISGVAVITAGIEAHGHNAPPFVTDGLLLSQVAAAINAQPGGVRCRMGHAEVAGVDGLHVLVGKIKNAYVDGDVVRADFCAGKGADKEEIARLMWLAEDAPEDAGLSIVPQDYEFIEEDGELHLRVQSMFAVDWVGVPAANPAGMLSKQQGQTPGKVQAMELNEAQIAFLKGLGLADDATPEDMKAKVDALDEEQAASFAALMDHPEKDVPIEDEPVAEAAVGAPVAASKKAKAAPALNKQVKASLAELEELATLAGLSSDWTLAALKAGPSPVEARKLALAEKAKKHKHDGGGVVITAGENLNIVSLRQAIPDAIMLRSGYKIEKTHERSRMLSDLSLLDMARHYFQSVGVKDAFMLSRAAVANLISPRHFRSKYPSLAQSSSDFSNILADSQNKALMTAYAEAPSTWQMWAKRGTTPDFKLNRRVQANELPKLTERKEGQGLDYTKITDRGESFTIKEYHGGLAITRVAMVNDDLSVFSDNTQKLGRAARSLEDDAAYSAISGVGPTMDDTGKLFNSTAQTTAGGHTNYTSSGTAISTTSLGVGFSAMFIQKGVKTGTDWADGRALEAMPKFLIVASPIQYIARQAISSTELLTSEALTSAGVMKGTSNPFHNSVTVIPTTRLATTYGTTTASTTAWVLATDPNDIATVEVTFLQGEETPVLTQESDFDTDDMRFKVRHAVVGTPLDFRGLYKNVGA